MRKYLTLFAALSLLGGGSCLMGCQASSAHDTTRKISWGTSVEVRTTTAQGPDVVAYDRIDLLAKDRTQPDADDIIREGAAAAGSGGS